MPHWEDSHCNIFPTREAAWEAAMKELDIVALSNYMPPQEEMDSWEIAPHGRQSFFDRFEEAFLDARQAWFEDNYWEIWDADEENINE